MQALQQISAERDAPLTSVEQAYRTEALVHSLEGQSFAIASAGNSQPPLQIRIPLLGAHQIENAAAAYAALQALGDTGFEIGEKAILEGFAAAKWPARFEILQRDPIVVIDAAHAPAAAIRLRETLDEYLPDRPVVLLIGVSADKDVSGILEALSPRVTNVIASRSTHPRAMAPDLLAGQARELGMHAEAIPEMPAALEAALHAAGQLSKNAIVLATGSLFAAASARIAWRERRAAKEPALSEGEGTI
jgi:dihydrofolate synthase/folylpolyglutamate synthase